jgi:subtilase family serine protease
MGLAPAFAAVPFPTKATPAAHDVGAAADFLGAKPMTVTLALKLKDEAGAQAALQSVYTKGSANFLQFLTPAQFKARFAQSDADVEKLAASLATYGLTATRTGASTVKVSGPAAALENAFRVSLREYEVASDGVSSAYHFEAPTTAPKIPAEISSSVHSVIGLSTRPQFAPRYLKGLNKVATQAQRVRSSTASSSGNQPGFWTVQDFEKYYNVTPLLTTHGDTGRNRTIAIVTLANLTVSDVYAYWSALGLDVASDRVKVIAVDGGAGAPSDGSGSFETTLDVEQSGGIATGARIFVYQAPNTSQAFVDAFVNAVEDNTAESISVSWGGWEYFDTISYSPVTDPFTGETVSAIRAYDELFLQAALQGQSMFAASGDAGAYDANDGLLPPDFSLALSVDDPAANPYITAAGGTTLAGTQIFQIISTGQLVTVNIPHERVWSWDYLLPLCDDLGFDPIDCGIFPVGSGGGVSIEYPLPFYQKGIVGIQKSQPAQSFLYEDTIPPTTIFTLPANYPGRNVPDVSLNADPDTGYVVYYTSDMNGFGIETFYGGTSFVAPQLNGTTALLVQFLKGKRIGLWNPALYEILSAKGAYSGKGAPFNAIAYGNNDFYTGRVGYSPAVGVGTLNVENFAVALEKAGY